MDAVVVTHNSARDLKKLLDCEGIREGFSRIIVVDNASTDNCVALAKEAGATVLARGVNDGFGAAANAGAKLTDGESFALLNPDIFFRDATAVAAAHESLKQSDTGIVAPRLMLPSGEVQDSARRVPSPLELLLRRTSVTSARRGVLLPDKRTPVPWAVGACLFIWKSAWHDIGGFDPRYKLYFEDVDLCVRMRAQGHKVVYDPSIEVDHRHVGASRRRLFSWAARQHMISALRFYCYHPLAIFRRHAYDV